jgi:hypothetical protein
MSDTLPPLPKGAVLVDDVPPLPQGAVLQPETAYDRFLTSLRNPQTGGRSGVFGPALVGGTGELIKGAGALTQMAFPDAGTRMVEVGEALTAGAKSVNPVSATAGQVGSYLAPFSALQKGVNVIKSIPQVQNVIGKLPSFAAATGEQAAIGTTLGYALTPDQQNREEAALYGGGFGAAGPAIGQAVNKVAQLLRGTPPTPAVTEGARKGLEAGYVIPPTQVKPSLLNRVLEGVAGKASTAQNASFQNQQVTNNLANVALGLPKETIITPQILNNIRNNAGQAYESLGISGTIKTSPKFNQALDEISVYKDAIKAEKDFPTGKKNDIIEVIDSLRSPSFDVSSAVSKINVLRGNADKAYSAGDKALGKANKAASEVLENTIENYLANTKQTELLQNFRDARQLIAKTYSVEKALNPASGTIDAKKLAQQLKANKPLTGELRTVAEFGSQFPKATQTTEVMGSLPQISPLDVGGAVLTSGGAYLAGGEAATPLGFATLLARPAFRSAALSSPVQQRLLNQGKNINPDYSNLARMLMLQGATKYGASQEEQ